MGRFLHVYIRFAVPALVLALTLLAMHRTDAPVVVDTETVMQTANEATSTTAADPTSPLQSTSTKNATKSTSSGSSTKAKIASVTATKPDSSSRIATSSPNDIVRIENAYTTPPLPFESVNTAARGALVNILCATKSVGALKPITGSGMIIDSRGVILTNAHVAQYVLIAQTGATDLRCTVRTGAPASARWTPVVLYVPHVWIDAHVSDILSSHAIGTGEHDYALLYIAESIDGSSRPQTFPFVSPDSREAIGFVDDSVLAASYPAEFVGGSAILDNLYPVTSITTIRKLFTFGIGSADALSLGGIIGAQSGSSGGGVLNQWARLIGLITTTSSGATTGERDLHAITTAYIDRDMKTQTGRTLSKTLALDPKTMSNAFAPEALSLGLRLINAITNP